MKKLNIVLSFLLIFVCIFTLCACDDNKDTEIQWTIVKEATCTEDGERYSIQNGEKVTEVILSTGHNYVDTICTKCHDKFKVGLICLHDADSPYDANFINAINEAKTVLRLSEEQVIIKCNIDESVNCYNTACELANDGCDIIFADSFGHEKYLLLAAEEYPDVQFCHSTGTKAHTSGLDNYGNAFASIYEGRYLVGVVGGLKLLDMFDSDGDGVITDEQAKIGYVGAYSYAEVISGYTAFYLGVKSIVPNVTMDVEFTGSWYDYNKEYQAAEDLIDDGCNLISQHADSMGAPTACEKRKVPNISYNTSNYSVCPDTFIISTRINWAPYYEYVIKQVLNGGSVITDYVGTFASKTVGLTNCGNYSVMPKDYSTTLLDVKSKLINGQIDVFDTNTFTVTVDKSSEDPRSWLNANATVDENGKLISYLADVDDYGDYVGDTEAIVNGVFVESQFRSAPYFDVLIDGITLKNKIV